MSILFQDLRFGLRMLHKNLGFTAVVIATLALGIGASTAVFSVIDPLLFRSLPYPNDRQLVSLGYLGPVDSNEFNVVSSYFDWQRESAPFLTMTAMRPSGGCDVMLAETPRRVTCSRVDTNFLQTFSISPMLGQDFRPEDNLPHAPMVALLSYGFWQEALSGDAQVLGKTLSIDDEPVRVIGILPRNFQMPVLGEMDVMLPARLDPSLPRSANSSSFLRTFARLREGATLDQARERMRPIFAATVQSDVPPVLRAEARLVIRSLRDRQIHDVKLASWMLLGSVLALLLAACVNVANLLLARTASREKELAMRSVLGASRGRLILQTLTESLTLGLLGGAAGCASAGALLRIAVHLAPSGTLSLEHARLDPRVLVFAWAASVGGALLFGMAPALERPRAESLVGWQSIGSRRTHLRKILVAGQVALSLILLGGASLLLRSLWNLESQPWGFEPENVVTASFSMRRHRHQNAQTAAAFLDEVEEKLSRIPGRGIFALSDTIPPGGVQVRPYSNLRIAGHSPVARQGGMVQFRWVSPGYFGAMGIRLLAGRDFDESERASGASPIIVSSTLARRLFGNENPIGQQIDLEDSGRYSQVVGVASDIKNNGPTLPSDPEYYRLRMHNSQGMGTSFVAVFRTSLDPAVLERWVRKEFAEVDPTLPISVATLEQRIDQVHQRPRFLATLVAMFAGLGLLLAAVGLYGVMSFIVARQTKEIGVRMAIGARPSDIAWQILKGAGTWTGIGLAAGLGGTFALARLIRGLLFGISPNDPISLAIATAVLVVTAGVAAWVPSRRAAKIDPIAALRSE